MKKEGLAQTIQQQPETEFSIVCRAKNGDKDAVEWIWKKYRNLMVGMIGEYWWYHRLDENEMESEAIMALLHKLEVFKPERVTRSPLEWEFKYMLINAAWHRRNRLKTKAKNGHLHSCMDDELKVESIVEQATENTSDELDYDVSMHRYFQYNPEEIVMNEAREPLEKKEKRFMKMLTPFQKTLLELRQTGMTVQQIADYMGCGFTKVRKQIVQARELGYSVLVEA